MTENEALKLMESLQISHDCEMIKTLDFQGTVIRALETLKQYRAIGTVEQLKTIFDGFWKLKDLCEEYEKYGLPEDYWKLNEICKEYSAIGTIEEFKALKEKSVAKKPEYAPDDSCLYSEYVCPNCHIRLPHFRQKYCQCGQKLDC